MPTEHAAVRVVHKPWGVADLQPWSSIDGSGAAVGELWFERADKDAPTPALLLKLLFTSEPLSIQVHPDDTFARAMGMPNGKSEAWYILSAQPDAQIGAGLKHQVTPQQLRMSIQNGSIAELIHWRPVAKGDVIYIPAGTIHAVGAGIVLAEIQQRSDATFRLFDYGRPRELHEDNGVAVAHPWPLRSPAIRRPLPRTGRFSSRANISFLSALTFLRVQAGRCLPNRRPGCSFSTATPQSVWPRHRSGSHLHWWRPHQYRGWRQWIVRADCVSRQPPDRFPVAETR